MYEGLKPKDKFEKPLDFRWPQQYDQWWECKFLSEGIIDQGKALQGYNNGLFRAYFNIVVVSPPKSPPQQKRKKDVTQEKHS